MNTSSWISSTTGGGASGEAVNMLSIMMHDEPMLQLGIRLLQNFCLAGGLQLRFKGNVPPTPNFARHIERHYLPFCREAIYSFMMVGFAPYRIRLLENGSSIPEMLPLVFILFKICIVFSLIYL